MITDPNGLETSFTYDVHCRETVKTVAWGTAASQKQVINTRYVNFGDPDAQYVETDQKSSNTTSGQDLQYSRQYFDGMGKVYKETAPGAVSAISASSVILRRFDQRGRMEWESIPITWADASDNFTAASRRVTYQYDRLGRVTKETMADTAYRTAEYRNEEREVQGQTTFFPEVYSKGFDCYNGSSLICDENLKAMDAAGNVILDLAYDRNLTDDPAGSSIERHTTYEYDHLNRLTKVVDPLGLTFTYEYDAYGNRIESSDPGLGRWTMEYYEDNTLKKQTDAKGQTIEFWYDQIGREIVKRVKRRDDAGTLLSTDDTYSCYDGGTHSWGASKCDTTTGDNIGRLTWQTQSQLTTTWSTIHKIGNSYDKRGNITTQTNWVSGKTYTWQAEYTVAGHLKRQTYYGHPGQHRHHLDARHHLRHRQPAGELRQPYHQYNL